VYDAVNRKRRNTMEITKELLQSILDAYPYEIVFTDRTHVVRWMNKTAKKRYKDRVFTGRSLFLCHNERAKAKIEEFLSEFLHGSLLCRLLFW
jgi:DUF438 domain-containing protein